MREHAPNNVVGALAVLFNTFEVAYQRGDNVVDFTALMLVERREYASSLPTFKRPASSMEWT
jgi:hypothetical protein